MGKRKLTKRNSIYISVVLVSFCAIGIILQQSVFSNRVVLKDELKIHRKLLHSSEREHACDCYSPFISNFTITNITSTSADFSWKCDAASTYQVKYGTTSKTTYFPLPIVTTPYKEYTVKLTGLKPKTKYVIGPSSICMQQCTRNDVSGINGKRKEIDVNKKSTWDFTTLDGTGILENTEEQKVLTAVSEARVAEITATEVTIRWKTDALATSQVEYGLKPEYGVKSEINTTPTRDHVIQLFDYKFGATYHARAVSTDPSGKTVYSADFTFETPSHETRIIDPMTVFNEPNPAQTRTSFTYHLFQSAQRMTIDIYTLSGKLVAALEAPQSSLKEGYSSVMWDLRDNAQKRVSNGVYVYKMKIYLPNNQVTEVKKSNLIVRK